MTISARAAQFAIRWLQRKHPYLLKEAVIPPGYHKHKDPEKKTLKGKYPVVSVTALYRKAGEQ